MEDEVKGKDGREGVEAVRDGVACGIDEILCIPGLGAPTVRPSIRTTPRKILSWPHKLSVHPHIIFWEVQCEFKFTFRFYKSTQKEKRANTYTERKKNKKRTQEMICSFVVPSKPFLRRRGMVLLLQLWQLLKHLIGMVTCMYI